MDDAIIIDLKQYIATTVETVVHNVVDPKFDAIDSRLGGIGSKLNVVDSRLGGIDSKLNVVDSKFDAIDSKFDVINSRFNTIDSKFDAIDSKFDAIDARFDENEIIQNEILNTLGETNNAILKAIGAQADHIDNHERRITKLEKRTA